MEELDAELDELQVRIAALPRPEPTTELRARVLRHARQQLQRGAWWWYVGATAAAIALWINLSWVASRSTSFDFARSHGSIDNQARQISALVPEVGEQEAYRQALVLGGGRGLAARVTSMLLPEMNQRNAL